MNTAKFAIAVFAVFAVSTASAATITGAVGDGARSLVYDSETGAVSVEVDGNTTGLLQVLSASGIFTAADAAFPAGGLFTADDDGELGWAALAGVNDDFELGLVAPAGLEEQFLLSDLTILFSTGFGGANESGDLVFLGGPAIPEPTTAILAMLGLAGVAARRRS